MNAPEKIWSINNKMTSSNDMSAYGPQWVEYTRTDLSQAAVAAALEAAAAKLQNVADNWDCGHNESRLCDCAPYVEQWGLAADEIRAQITDPQRDALQAVIDAAKAEARAMVAAKLTFPADVLEFALKIGRAEWGQTDPKTAAEHAADMASTVEKTAAHFGQTELQSLNGLYIEGTGIVICHTGVSPNSPEISRILTGLWNMIYDAAQIGAKP